MHPDTMQMLIPVVYYWLAVGFPLGILLGVLLALARVSGVDFRQWFWDPTQTSEVLDDTWIGLTRGAAYVLFGAAFVSLVFGSAWQWLWLDDTCRWGNFSGSILTALADCVGYWAHWRHVTAILVGIAVAQVIADLAWRAGLRWLPVLPARARALVRRNDIDAPPTPAARPQRRRLIICCDGTWNWPQPDRETNVVRLVRAIKPIADPRQDHPEDQPVTQIVHYHLGVGTGNIVDRIVGGGAGVGLSSSVKSCYGFLVDNYRPGDEIQLYGFSRGAYVVRSVAGMVGCVGLLQKSEMGHFYEAWDWYTKRQDRQVAELDGFAPHRHRPEAVTIQCIGVWDTVGALGIPGSRFCATAYTFHETALGPRVRHAFQALAIDERRGNFQAAPWVTPRQQAGAPQVLRQVWFPGVHSNIGGGYLNHGLSDTTLLWMVSQILAYGLLDLDEDCITNSLDQSAPYQEGKLEDSRTFFWILLGCPVPRPVGSTSTTEKIHASAFGYDQGVYWGQRRRNWLGQTDVAECALTEFEETHAVKVQGARVRPPPPLPANIGVCDWIMQQIGGSS